MLRCSWLAGLALAALAMPAAASQWQVDPARSSLALEGDQGGRPLLARFERFQAEVSFDPKNLAA